MLINERLLRQFWESQDVQGTYPYSRLTYWQKVCLVHTTAYVNFLARHNRHERARRRGNFGDWLAKHWRLMN